MFFLSPQRSEFCDFPDIVDHAVEFPLNVHLLLAPEGESTEAESVADVREDRLDSAHPPAVNMAAHGSVKLLDHSLRKALFHIRHFVGEYSHLAVFCIDVSHTFLLDIAYPAV